MLRFPESEDFVQSSMFANTSYVTVFHRAVSVHALQQQETKLLEISVWHCLFEGAGVVEISYDM